MAALGDIIYRGSSVWKRLVGNTTTRRQMLCQTGPGSGSAAPVWTDMVVDRVTTNLTDAQIKALPTTPIDIVPAPGAGLFLIPMYAEVRLDTSAGAYTNLDAGAYMTIVWGNDDLWSDYFANDSTATPALTYVSDTFGATFESRITLGRWRDTRDASSGWGTLASSMTLQSNARMKLSFNNNGSGNLTGGNAANTAEVATFYAVGTV